jgi:hypothetical protein
LVPSEWGLGKTDFPEKWVFTVNANRTVLIGARPLGALHNKFPFDIMELEPEGYALFNRSFTEVLQPVQDTMDWLLNSHFYNVRKTINNQMIVDPSRVVMKDVLDPRAGGVFRLRPAAYGTPVDQAIKQLQVTDVTRGNLADMELMNQIGQRTTGVSDQIMGQVNAGGRKTATEVRTSTTFGINRLKTNAEYFSAMGWSPLAQKMVQNSQQYYDGEKKFKIVGDLITEAGQQFIEVNPENITGFYDFVPVDGTLPIDRFAQANLWRSMLGDMRNLPEVLMQYDIGRIFAWVAKLAGLKNIEQFRTQIVPDAQLAAQAQAGNIVPVPQPNATPTEPGQVANLGQTG